MPLETPAFWYRKDSAATAMLTPLSAIYLAGHRLRQKLARPYRSSLPVLCVGNIVAGGSGKTPAVLALLDVIRNGGMAKDPCILTRGYGGKLKGPTQTDPQIHNFRDVGDEALLLARQAPVLVSADRAAGARAAELQGADLILMDDGFQNPGLVKTCSFLVVDSMSEFGNGCLLPAGPLREPLSEALARANGCILVGDGPVPKELADTPVFRAHITAHIKDSCFSGDFFAFAGLGRPEKFKKTLEDSGVHVTGWKSFADHHPYTEKDMRTLTALAANKNAQLLTTEKDLVRIPETFRDRVRAFPIAMVFEDSEGIRDFLSRHIKEPVVER